MCCSPDCLLAFLAVLFPPIAVWVKVGICTADSFINIALCCLGYLPGLIHSWYIILKYPEDLEDPSAYAAFGSVEGHGHPHPAGHGQTTRNGRVMYYVVPSAVPQYGYSDDDHHGHGHGHGGPHDAPKVVPQAQRSYGAVDETGGAGPSEEAPRQPPSYAEAVRGDYKIQHD
ncbi:hypothetical protein KEM55_001206 [Ascosphaera atra]|nr:hypothetical protein KEM55_001206 [Ascosphaera atra]